MKYNQQRKRTGGGRTIRRDKASEDVFELFPRSAATCSLQTGFEGPVLRGWVNYFAIGDASRCFGFVKDWVEKKVRRRLMRGRNRRGFGWKRWSRRWLYDALGLFDQYRVRRPAAKALPAR